MAERLAENGFLLDFRVMGRGFTWESQDLTQDAAAARQAWLEACALLTSGEVDVLVLDEMTYVMNYGWVSVEEVLAALVARPAGMSVVITGRAAPQALLDKADLVTEMQPMKHPFDQGISAQPGIDF